MTRSTPARISGGALLVLALLVLVLAAPLTQRGIAGRPFPLLSGDAPDAGRCLDDADASRTVECSRAHTAQIVTAWNTWDGHVAGRDAGDLRRDCWERGRAALAPLGLDRSDPYAGVLPSPAWAPPPLIVDTDIVMSTTDADPSPWVACVVRPRSAVTPDIDAPLARVGLYSGAIETLIPLAGRPVNLRSCYELPELLPATVSCRSWHRGEVLAARSTSGSAGPDDNSACDGIAADLLRTEDPSRGGLLTVRVEARPAVQQVNRLPADQGELTVLLCVVEAGSGTFLTDSVVGLGDNPPPTT